MERDERYEVNSQGSVVIGTPVTLTPSEKKTMIESMEMRKRTMLLSQTAL